MEHETATGMDLPHDDLVLQAITYRRHVGADLPAIRAYLQFRVPEGHNPEEDRAALGRLEQTGTIVRVGKQWFLSASAHRQARGAAFPPEYKFEDAWILLALLYRRDHEPSTLAEIIAVADWMNHALPGLEELHGALNRLLTARLIRVKGERFSVTERAVELFTRIEQACPRQVLAQLAGLERMLACPCCGPPLKAVRWNLILTREWYERALKEYQKQFQPS